MPKILIAESLDENVLGEICQSTKIEFVYKPDISPLELETEIAAYDGLIVRPKPVSETAIRNAKNLKLVIRGGAGVNSIALDTCRELGVKVANTPGLNSDATAEFTFVLMLHTFARRQETRADELSRKGNPGIPENYMGNELKGKKLGLIGLGNIGQRVARIAEAFGMEVVAYARNEKRLNIRQFNNIHDVLKSGCDIISLHIPLSAETTGIIGSKEFAMMKKGTVIINTARPQLIDVTAFAEALSNGQISSFGIDGDYDLVEPFIKADRAAKGLVTHHIADSTYEAQANITRAVLTQMIAYFERNEEINRVL